MANMAHRERGKEQRREDKDAMNCKENKYTVENKEIVEKTEQDQPKSKINIVVIEIL